MQQRLRQLSLRARRSGACAEFSSAARTRIGGEAALAFVIAGPGVRATLALPGRPDGGVPHSSCAGLNPRIHAGLDYLTGIQTSIVPVPVLGLKSLP